MAPANYKIKVSKFSIYFDNMQKYADTWAAGSVALGVVWSPERAHMRGNQ